MGKPDSIIPPLYLRREPTTDATARRYLSPTQFATTFDVVAYSDRAALPSQEVARWLGTASAPRMKRHRQIAVTLNCVRRTAFWLDDLPCPLTIGWRRLP